MICHGPVPVLAGGEEFGEAGLKDGLEFGWGEEFFEEAEVGVDGDFAVGYFDGAFDGVLEEAHFGGHAEGHYRAGPAAVGVCDFQHGDRQAFEEVVERLIDDFDCLLFGLPMRESDLHPSIRT